MQIPKSVLLAMAFTPIVGHADDLKDVIERRMRAHINETFFFVEVGDRTHAFNGRVRGGAISSNSIYGTIFEYANFEYKYRSLPLSQADIANDIVWRGELEVFVSPYRKIVYTNGVGPLGSVNTMSPEVCWENWKNMDREMALKWQFVLKKSGWHPTVFRMDHRRWLGDPPITRDGTPSRETVTALLRYKRCGY